MDRAVEAAIARARAHTGRVAVIIAPASSEDLCLRIAGTESRIAAVVVSPEEAGALVPGHALREYRELASAEGAWLVWDETRMDCRSETCRHAARVGVRPDAACYSRGGSW